MSCQEWECIAARNIGCCVVSCNFVLSFFATLNFGSLASNEIFRKGTFFSSPTSNKGLDGSQHELFDLGEQGCMLQHVVAMLFGRCFVMSFFAV